MRRNLLNILALETSTEYCSVALWQDGAVDGSEARVVQSHSERLLAMVDALLARHGMNFAALDAIAFGEGPGSFTGLRIACGVTQGLAFAANLPVIGVGTLLAMAHATRAERVICCVDARMQEIYHAAYERNGECWVARHEPGVYPPHAAPLPANGGWLGCGNAFSVYRDSLLSRYDSVLGAVDERIHARAHEVAQPAAPMCGRGGIRDAAAAAPLYVRDKVALKSHER